MRRACEIGHCRLWWRVPFNPASRHRRGSPTYGDLPTLSLYRRLSNPCREQVPGAYGCGSNSTSRLGIVRLHRTRRAPARDTRAEAAD